MDFQKFVMLTEKYAPSFKFDSQQYLYADDTEWAIAAYNNNEDEEEDYPLDTVCIAYDFDFDPDTGEIYVINLANEKLTKWENYDILDDEEAIKVRLTRLERRYHECVAAAREYMEDKEADEEKEQNFGVPIIAW